jgi:hypothetical protein
VREWFAQLDAPSSQLVTFDLSAIGRSWRSPSASQLDAVLGAAYAVLFFVQAGLFVRVGLVRGDLTFTSGRGIAGLIGWAALGYGLLVYPLLGAALGHGWPQAPLLAWRRARRPSPRSGCCCPPLHHCPATCSSFRWCGRSSRRWPPSGHGVHEDLGLAVIGALTVVVVLARDRRRDFRGVLSGHRRDGPRDHVTAA